MIKAILAGALIYFIALISVFLIVNHLDVSIEVIKEGEEDNDK